MADDSGENDPKGKNTADGSEPGDRSPALSANWDARIAEAREKRERILAKRKASGPGKVPAGKSHPTPPSGLSGGEDPSPFRNEPAGVAPDILKATVPENLQRKAAARVSSDETVSGGEDTPRRPHDPLETPVATVSAITAKQNESVASTMPVFRHPLDDPAVSASGSRARVAMPPLAAQLPPADPKTRLRAFSHWLESAGTPVRVAVVAFACCFGLGFGMVLSFGILAAFGWINPTQPTAALTRPVATEPPDVVPDVLTRTNVQMLAPLPVPETARLTTPGFAAQDRPRKAAPPLAGAAPKDASPERLLSRGPRIGTTIPSLTQPETGGVRPDRLARAADQLAYVAAAPARPGAVYTLSEELPVMADSNKIALWTDLAPLHVPSEDVQSYVAPDIVFASTVFRPSPRLPGPAPEAAPVLTAAAARLVPVMPAAFPGSMTGILPAVPRTAAPDPRPATITPAPRVSGTATKVLYTPDNGDGLPQIGAPASGPPTLAGRLGYSVADRAKFSLVTFAPVSVSDSDITAQRTLLRETGFPIGALNRVSFRVSRTHVRYYHPDDTEVARAIAEEVGGPARDFTNISSSAPVGRVEVWMTGNSRRTAQPVQRQRSAAAPRTPTAAERQTAAREALRNRLINTLRKEEYK